jgi:hypothetical protein
LKENRQKNPPGGKGIKAARRCIWLGDVGDVVNYLIVAEVEKEGEVKQGPSGERKISEDSNVREIEPMLYEASDFLKYRLDRWAT